MIDQTPPPIVDNDAPEPVVCLTHIRWANPCLADTHDDPRPCVESHSVEHVQLLRRFHDGQISEAEITAGFLE